MRPEDISIRWPNGQTSICKAGQSWVEEAQKAGITIPTGCLTGSCGACEIEVDGEVIRSCISSIAKTQSNNINVDFSYDPYW